jgi:hypothetical protein
LARATCSAADSTLWLTMRTEAVALATPSKVTLALVACTPRGPGPPMRTDWRSDRPLYCSTKCSSGAGPRPSTKTGSCCDTTCTSTSRPCGSSTISRSTGVPEKPGSAAKSTDSKT